jgi:ankyrin repeat protein
MLISNGADVNAKTRLKWSILYIAALHGHTEMIKMLISHGADINARNKTGVTPLRIAASRGKRKAFNLLKELGGEGF